MNIRCLILWSSVLSLRQNVRNADEIGIFRLSENSEVATRREHKGTESPGVARRVPEFPPEHSPSVHSLQARDESYNAADDFSRSLDDCYRAIRERVAAGGKGCVMTEILMMIVVLGTVTLALAIDVVTVVAWTRRRWR
jgi:hypothetical protein